MKKDFKSNLYFLALERFLINGESSFTLSDTHKVEIIAKDGIYRNDLVYEYPKEEPAINFVVTIVGEKGPIYRTIFQKVTDIKLKELLELSDEEKRAFINASKGFFKKRFKSPSYFEISAAQDSPLLPEAEMFSAGNPSRDIQKMVSEQAPTGKKM